MAPRSMSGHELIQTERPRRAVDAAFLTRLSPAAGLGHSESPASGVIIPLHRGLAKPNPRDTEAQSGGLGCPIRLLWRRFSDREAAL